MNELLIALSQYPSLLKAFVFGGLLLPAGIVLTQMIKEI